MKELETAKLVVGDGEIIPRTATRALIAMFLRRVASGEWDADALARSLLEEPYGEASVSMDEAITAIRERLDHAPPRRPLPKWRG